jgi:hypothetical protein
MKVGIFGSRDGVPQEVVAQYLAPRFNPSIILVSGGARGVDSFAEQAWQSLGGNIISLRPVRLDPDRWAVERWETKEQRVYIPLGHPEWADFNSAAFYRDMLIAEESDRGVAFRHNYSRGTGHTITFFETLGKPCAVHLS